MNEKKIRASDFLALGLYSFAGFGLEIVLSMVLPSILGVQSSEYTIVHHCVHWMLTCVLWGVMVVFLMNFSRRKYSFNIMKFSETPELKAWLIAIVIAAIAIAATTIAWGGLKPIQEYDGMPKLIFQNIYYLFEAALIVLTIAFGQKYGEMLTKREELPYGGLFLALTWGLIHILLQGFQTGIYAFAMAILYGVIYLVFKKNIRYAYILIAVIFIV